MAAMGRKRTLGLGRQLTSVSESATQYTHPLASFVLECLPQRPRRGRLNGVGNGPVEARCSITSFWQEEQQGSDVVGRERVFKDIDAGRRVGQLLSIKLVRQLPADVVQSPHCILNHYATSLRTG